MRQLRGNDLSSRNGASATAVAFVTYSLIPYLGIVFCPGAVVMGIVGWVNSQRSLEDDTRRASSVCTLAGIFMLGVQVLLWWLLYKVPSWAGINQAGATGPPF